MEERFEFCRINCRVLFECGRVVLNVVWSVEMWWLLAEVVLEELVGGSCFTMKIWSFDVKERTIHVYVSIYLCRLPVYVFIDLCN